MTAVSARSSGASASQHRAASAPSSSRSTSRNPDLDVWSRHRLRPPFEVLAEFDPGDGRFGSPCIRQPSAPRRCARPRGPRCRPPKAPRDPRFPHHAVPISRDPVEPSDTIALFVVVPRDGYDGRRSRRHHRRSLRRAWSLYNPTECGFSGLSFRDRLALVLDKTSAYSRRAIQHDNVRNQVPHGALRSKLIDASSVAHGFYLIHSAPTRS